jgi:DNA gyrase subunit A
LGYVKRTPINAYRTQKRGGKGLQGMATRDEDFVEKIFGASTHDTILVFSNWGKVYWLRVYEIPEGARATRGKAINNLIRLGATEKVAAILPIKAFSDDEFVLFATKSGTVKKTALSSYANQRADGIIAIGLEGDELVQVRITSGNQDVIISTAEGQAIRFVETDVRPMGRGAAGVRGNSLGKDDYVVGMDVVVPGKTILTISERGYGKRTDLEEYRKQGRGGSGIITMKTTDKTGKVITATQVDDSNDLMLITNKGQIIRQKVKAISLIGRNTQGVKLFNVEADEMVVSAALVDASEDEEVGTGDNGGDTTESTD